MPIDLELISRGQEAKRQGKLDEFLSKHPELGPLLVPQLVQDPTPPTEPTSETPGFEFSEGIFAHYLDHLKKTFGGSNKEEKISKIKKNIESTSYRMAIREPEVKRSGYGLVIGRIQSGKTAHMFGLATRAIDPLHNHPPFDTVIVLSGLTNDLRLQTRDRISKALIGFTEPPTILPPRDVDLKEQDDTSTKEAITNHLESPKSPMLIVIKKNHLVLGHLLDSINASDKGGILERRVLIIDDEADHASIDTAEPMHEESIDNPSETNRILRSIIKRFSRSSICWYIGYTATPFANLLIEKGMHDPPNEYGPSLHPRDMIHALPKPEGHLDNEQYFMVQDSPHVLVRNPVIERSDEERSEIQKIVFRHILTSFLKRHRGIDGHHTTLIHTDMGRPEHKRISQLVRTATREIADQGIAYITYKKLRKILGEYTGTLSDEERRAAEKFISIEDEDRFDQFTDLLDTVIVAEVNSRPREPGEDSPQDLDYSRSDGKSRSYIAVGGTRLSRGLTLEGLTTSWFTRRPVNPRYDTMLQMARWCGYRTHVFPDDTEVSYSDLVRILTTEEIRRDFLMIGNEEVNIRNRIESLPEDADPLQEILWIRQHPGLHITAPEKMKGVRERSWGGVMKSVIWSYHSPILGADAAQFAPKLFIQAKSLIENAVALNDNRTNEGGFELFRNVHHDAIMSFLKFYKDSLHKCSTRDDLERLIESGQGTNQFWDVGVHTPSRKSHTENVYDIQIGLVNRSRDDLDESRFKIIQNSHEDTQVGLPPATMTRQKPLILLYLVDPASTQSHKGLKRVFEQGINTSIPVFGICLPPAVLGDGGIEYAAGE